MITDMRFVIFQRHAMIWGKSNNT